MGYVFRTFFVPIERNVFWELVTFTTGDTGICEKHPGGKKIEVLNAHRICHEWEMSDVYSFLVLLQRKSYEIRIIDNNNTIDS